MSNILSDEQLRLVTSSYFENSRKPDFSELADVVAATNKLAIHAALFNLLAANRLKILGCDKSSGELKFRVRKETTKR